MFYKCQNEQLESQPLFQVSQITAIAWYSLRETEGISLPGSSRPSLQEPGIGKYWSASGLLIFMPDVRLNTRVEQPYHVTIIVHIQHTSAH